MDFALVRLRFRGVAFVLFIGVLATAPFLGGVLVVVADRLVLILTLVSIGRDLKFI